MAPRTEARLVSAVDPSGRSLHSGLVFGSLVVQSDRLRWDRLVPWREPRRIEVPFESVRQIVFSGGVDVQASHWRQLSFFVSSPSKVAERLAQLGFSLHQRPSYPDVRIAVRPGQEPDWDAI